jgi:hypothetical protein
LARGELTAEHDQHAGKALLALVPARFVRRSSRTTPDLAAPSEGNPLVVSPTTKPTTGCEVWLDRCGVFRCMRVAVAQRVGLTLLYD